MPFAVEDQDTVCPYVGQGIHGPMVKAFQIPGRKTVRGTECEQCRFSRGKFPVYRQHESFGSVDCIGGELDLFTFVVTDEQKCGNHGDGQNAHHNQQPQRGSYAGRVTDLEPRMRRGLR